VTCSRKPHGNVEGIGGVTPTSWYHTEREAIGYIENGTYLYYVTYAGVTTQVHVVKKADGTKYLHTDPDRTKQNNLLKIQDCPP
jgi:hypothetical protein